MYGKFLVLILLGASVLPTHASPRQATYMTVHSGTFSIYDPIQGIGLPADPWSNIQNPSANLVGGYVELGDVSMFFGLPMAIYTSNGSYQPYGGYITAPGGPVPTATLDKVANTISIDLSAFTWFWNGVNYSQGNTNVTGNWNPVSGVYLLAWESPFVGGPFTGITGQWTMMGVAAIPEPATYTQMLAALALMLPLLSRVRVRHQSTWPAP